VAVHELDYLLWLIGPARSVSALVRRVSELETDVEDVASISMELSSGGVAEIDVDYFDRAYTRGCRLVGSEGTLHWSWEDERLTRHDASGASSQMRVPSDVAPAYHRQLERFLTAILDGAPPPVPAGEARRVLEVLDAARASSRSGRRVAVATDVTLRAAGRGDAELLRAWRNDPETRRWLRNSREIDLDAQAPWPERMLTDTTTQLSIAESDKKPIGHVRVDHEAGGTAELQVVLAPEARGRGLGARVLIEAAAQVLAKPAVSLLCARVKPGHEAALRAFARAGFHPAGTDADGLVRLERPRASR
jgi:RimJ/RimL family protein N-acetyltransferase